MKSFATSALTSIMQLRYPYILYNPYKVYNMKEAISIKNFLNINYFKYH